jgi:hypothetical protein
VRNRPPNVNASLIHEARMIIEMFAQFMPRRDHGPRLRPRRTNEYPPAPAAPPMQCYSCLVLKKGSRQPINNAVTIMGGNALCQEHV